MNFQSNYISLENSTESILFSDANIVLYGNGIEESAELYYASSNDEMSIVGIKTTGIPSLMLTYTDLELHLKFPISYDDTYSDSFSAEAENHLGQNYVRSGNIEIKADGYGTLILPETTISNALRIRTIKNYNDVESGEIAFEYIDTIYNWYDGIHNFPLATASNIQSFITDFEGPALSISTISFTDQFTTTTALNSIEKQNQFSFYPNPATDFIYTNKATTIEIYDLRGALVKSEYMKNKGVLRVEYEDDIAKLLDGQHRIAGFQNYEGKRGTFELIITIYVDMKLEDQAIVFATINKEQKNVSNSLVTDLFAFAESRSPQKTGHNIARALNKKEGSPFFDKIKILGTAESSNETITQSTFVESILKYITREKQADRDFYRRNKKDKNIKLPHINE